jgi:hypothetical protein
VSENFTVVSRLWFERSPAITADLAMQKSIYL